MNNKDPNNDFSLNDIPKKNIHQVPDGYFEKLPNHIQQIIRGQKSNGIWALSWPPSKIFVGTLSAASIIILTLYLSIFKHHEGINFKTVAIQKPLIPSPRAANDSVKIGNNLNKKTFEDISLTPLKELVEKDNKAIVYKDTSKLGKPEQVAKVDAEVLIAQLDKTAISVYLETENTEEYEWEEINVKM